MLTNILLHFGDPKSLSSLYKQGAFFMAKVVKVFMLFLVLFSFSLNAQTENKEVSPETVNQENSKFINGSELKTEIESILVAEEQLIEHKRKHSDSILKSTKGYPVRGLANDTLFYIYSKIGASTPKDRATNISSKIKALYDDDFFEPDSILVLASEGTYDIVYGEIIIMNVSKSDAMWHNKPLEALAIDYKNDIKNAISSVKEERKLSKILIRFGVAFLVIGFIGFLIWLLRKAHHRLMVWVESKKDKWLKSLSYKDYTVLTAEQELNAVFFLLKVLRWLIFILILYITLPIVFSIFPISRHWAGTLFHLIWSPFKVIFVSIWDYLPNLFSILVIYLVMRYVIKGIRYVFKEIEVENLKISGFHSDWAIPTFSIVKFLLYAFMFVLIFPFLPGSDSNIFKGVSVFVGILFSLGSSTAIANMVAGLVITYMRPFKIGDRIKIADVSGDVVEKSLLVTRIRTIKNEIITIPNSSVLSGNTINYSSDANERGLILHTTVTIGYDVPWKDIHQALIDAALLTDHILKTPIPFVLQTSLDDFYVAYQINAYTKEASKQAHIYSQLNQNIQNVCNERGIEILSPHYRAARDGNNTTIPAEYLPKDYTAPSFNVKIDKKE
ncbi:mechanosensitive ion channel family protein [Formosa sp. PL04]|uniref:mechanosensitive ion channel family protein n=1 Tax=Formosa sp. PL04 TaxID=3081755 RepID=UPI00298195CB|nr:mechanosensitive ion channel family protein [Formosa sp. PL04]MDW5290156.1 mechanosensitive ion channel family protein [Formosa sp. PL04]